MRGSILAHYGFEKSARTLMRKEKTELGYNLDLLKAGRTGCTKMLAALCAGSSIALAASALMAPVLDLSREEVENFTMTQLISSCVNTEFSALGTTMIAQQMLSQVCVWAFGGVAMAA